MWTRRVFAVFSCIIINAACIFYQQHLDSAKLLACAAVHAVNQATLMEPLVVTERLQVYGRSGAGGSAKASPQGQQHSGFAPLDVFVEKGARIDHDVLPQTPGRGFVRIVYFHGAIKREGFAQEAVVRAQIQAASEQSRHNFNHLKKQFKFLVSLAYNRMRCVLVRRPRQRRPVE